jgi:hypothetical protein
MLQNELELEEKQKFMVQAHKTQALKDKVEKDIRWSNYYGEKNPLPEVD